MAYIPVNSIISQWKSQENESLLRTSLTSMAQSRQNSDVSPFYFPTGNGMATDCQGLKAGTIDRVTDILIAGHGIDDKKVQGALKKGAEMQNVSELGSPMLDELVAARTLWAVATLSGSKNEISDATLLLQGIQTEMKNLSPSPAMAGDASQAASRQRDGRD